MNRAETLDAARQAVLVDRAATHGKPENSFALIADLWSALLGMDVQPFQVTLMLATLKVARGWDNPAHADNFVDLAGYAACAAELADEADADPVQREGDMIAGFLKRTMEATENLPVYHPNWATQDPRPVPVTGEDAAGEPGEGAGVDSATEQTPCAVEAAPDTAKQAACAPETPAVEEAAPTRPVPSYKPPRVRNEDGLWTGVYTADEDEEIVELRAFGEPTKAIAAKLERKLDSIQTRCATVLKERIAARKIEVEARAQASDGPALNEFSAPDLTLSEHLDNLPADGWMPQDDTDLLAVTLEGNIAIADLEAKFGRRMVAIRARLRALTLSGAFDPADVLAEMEARHG